MEKEKDNEYGHHQGKKLFQGDLHHIIDCKSCGYRHILPLPTKQQLEQFYEDEYYQSEKTEYFKDADEDHDWYRIDYGVRLDLISEALARVGSVLDVGCGPGSFLRVAKEKGWRVAGIDPSAPAAHYANGYDLNVTHGFFSAENNFEHETFDFVHMSNVLEHVAEPLDILRAARDLIKPGGYVTVSVPNDFNDFQISVVDSDNVAPWWIVPDHHLNYFDFDSLENILRRTGFEITDRTTNFPMELFLLMGENYLEDKALGKNCHNRRKELDKKLFSHDKSVYGRFYRQLASAGLGRLAIITARKVPT